MNQDLGTRVNSSCDELEGAIPMFEQFGGLVVVDTDVEVIELAREKVVYFTRHVEYVANSISLQFFQISSIPL